MILCTVYFKSFLLKSICFPWYPVRLFSNVEQNMNMASYVSILCNLLNCSEGTANLLLNRNKRVLTLDLSKVHKVALFCRDNLKLSEVIGLPAMMSVSPSLLSDRTSTLRELGCHRVTAGNVLFFKQFIKETPSKLHRNGFLTFPETYFTEIVGRLNCPDDLKLQMTSRLLELHSNNTKLSKIKAAVNAMYLAWRLQYSEEKAMDLLHNHSLLCTKSLASLERICDILLENLEIPISKIYSSPSLLTLDSDNLKELVSKVPKVCGVSIQHVVKRQPSILKRSANSLHDTVSVLENHGVTNAQLLSCPKILNFSASTILSRLDVLTCMEKSDIMKEDEKFLWLIVHFSNINKCTEIMGNLKVPCSSNFSSDKASVQQKSLPNGGRSSLRDICFYLAILFGTAVEDIKLELKQYPNVYLSSAQNAQKVVEYLSVQSRITKEQLWNGLGIVLYDANVVIEYFTDLPNREDLNPPFSESIGHPNFIQLLIYTIEKDQKFTGNGVYVRPTEKQTEFGENENLSLDPEAIFTPNAENCDCVYNAKDM